MSKISNALDMLMLLSTKRKYSIKELSSILEVSERMVRVYKGELEKCGIYVDTIMGPYGGYVLNQSISLPERKFNNFDYELLNKYINNENSKEDKEKLILLRNKIKGVYLSSKKDIEDLYLKGDILDKYNVLTRAIKEHYKVKITYYSYNKGNNERVIHPAHMFLFESGWFCAAFCENKKDIRHFELKRISKFELLNEKF